MRVRIVVKAGGSLLDNNDSVREIVRDIVVLSKKHEVVFVHGWGRHLNRLSDKYGIRQKWVGKPRPWRVTDEDTIELVRNLVCGEVNGHLCFLVGEAGGKAVGVNGNMSKAIVAKELEYITWVEDGVEKKDWIGFTGLTKSVNVELLELLLKGKFIPVLASLAQGEKFECLNINGDELAGVAAVQLKADALVLLSDVKGFYMDAKDEKSFVGELSVGAVEKMLSEKKISGGMVAKVEAGLQAKKDGVKLVVLADGRLKKPVSEALKKTGTVIIE